MTTESIVIGLASAAAVFFVINIVLMVVNFRQLRAALRELFSISLAIQTFANGIAATLASSSRLEQTADNVAADLSAAHARADAVGSGNHGAAADAAAQQTAKEKLLT